MKLKTKRLLAAALALSLTANISLAAFAVSYDLNDGDVHINGDDDGTVSSYQDLTGEDGNASKSDTSYDTDIDITSNGKETTNTVTIEGDVSDATITVKDANIVVEDDYSAGIDIKDGSVVDDLTIEDTEITVNGTGSAGIEVGDEAEADITLSGDNDITLDADKTSGIKIGDNSEVTLTINGDTAIEVDNDLLANLAEQETVYKTEDGVVTVAGATVRPNIEGITIGGEVTSLSGEGSKLGSDVTITTEEKDSSLTIKGATVGIHIYDQSELTIDGNGVNNELVNEGDTDNDIDERALEVNILETQGTNTDVSGHGILNYGKLTITDNTQFTIDSVTQNEHYEQSANLEGIGSKGSDGVEISGGADVTISGVNAEKSGTLGNGISMSNSDGVDGYVAANDNLTIKGTGTTVTITGTSDDGIYLEGGENLEVSGGATLTIGEEGGSDIGRHGIYVGESTAEGRGKVTISGEETAVYINNSATTPDHAGLYFSSKAQTDTYNRYLIVTDKAALNINGGYYGIHASNANVDINNNANVTIDGAIYGIYLRGTNNTNFDVNDATIDIVAVTDRGIVVGSMEKTFINNKTVNIVNNAKVNIDSKGESIILFGGNNILTIDNATVIANNDIAFNGSSSFENTDEKARTSTIYINNGARVEAASIFDYAGWRQVVYNYNTTDIPDGMGKLYVTGGTLKLTTDTTEEDKNKKLYVLGFEDATTLYKGTPWLWPTSGEKNGDEKLTNFRLNADELLAFQKANKGEMTDEQFLEAYGYVITTGDGSITAKDEDNTPLGENQLVFQTYGADESGNYIDYNDNGATNLTYTEWYVVDLEKYRNEDGELDIDDLWVWTPAVVLSYYILDEGKTLDDAVPYDESTPWEPEGDRNDVSFVEEDGKYYQVDENGNYVYEIAVDEDGNERTDEDGNPVYVYDEEGNPVRVEVEVDPGIATRATSDHDVIIRGMFLDFGNFKTNEKYETYEATSDDAKTTAFADAQKAYPGYTFWVYNPFDNENVIDLDTIRVTEGEDGQYYQVDEDGHVLSDKALDLKAGNTYVLYDNEKYFKVDSIDEDGNIVLATDENGNRIEMVNGEWVEFTSMGRIRSKSQATDETEENYKNGFALKDPKTPDEEEPDPTPQEPTTEEPDEPREPVDHEHPHPEIPVDPVVPVTPETPAQPGETPAETPADPEAPAETPETPASSTPKTGDDSNVAIYLVMAALSGAALIGLGVTGRKKNEEV